MRRITRIVIVLVIAITAARPCFAMDFEGRTGIEYSGWESDEDESGGQLLIPLECNGSQGDLQFQLNTGIAHTTYENPIVTGAASGLDDTVSGLTDTKLGVSYQMLETFPVALLLALDLNLPTGRTGLADALRFYIQDPDLYRVSGLGQGLNINPTVTVAKQWGDFQAGLGLGYAWRGAYDYSETLADYDPGDIFNMVVELDYDIAANWKTRVFGEKAWYGTSTVNGGDFSQTGGFFMLGCDLQYHAAEWDGWFGVASIFREKGKYLTPGAGLVTEAHSGYGDEWNAELGMRYRMNEKIGFNALLQYLGVQANDYPETDIYYFGPRTKYSLQFGATYAFSSDLSADCRLAGFTMDDDPNIYHPGESRSFKGYTIGLFATKSL